MEIINEKNKLTGSDVFRIDTVTPYPEGYHETSEEAREENCAATFCLKIQAHADNMTDYDVICLGYPNWWGSMPKLHLHFLDVALVAFSNRTFTPMSVVNPQKKILMKSAGYPIKVSAKMR